MKSKLEGMITINTKLSKLPKEKHLKIINASLEAFAKYGYKKTSTSEIAKKADISKSLLFHYFGNKLTLYTYVYDYSYTLFSDELKNNIDLTVPDILERMSQTMKSKIKLFKKYPDLLTFIKSAYLEEDETIKSLIKNTDSESRKYLHEVFYTGIDYSLFKPEIDVNLAIKTMNYTFEKWSTDYMQQSKQKDMNESEINYISDELDKFMDLFRIAFYK